MEFSLKNLALGMKGSISSCLTPLRSDVYRLLEMGLCTGANIQVIRKSHTQGVIEIALADSRLCIANELAQQFIVTPEKE